MLKPVTPTEGLLHGFLFLLTCATTTLAGVQWLNKNPFELSNFNEGIAYAALMMAFLTSHEIGHYVAARRAGVSASLPYFLPFPSFFGLFPFGTLGAVIRLRETVESRRVLLSIGAAGPISGFILSVSILLVGFATLPEKGYLYSIHPEYLQMESIPEGGLKFGSSIAYMILESTISPRNAFVPPMNEIYHYPFLCVGWFGLFVTSLNLIPIGQLDGGHIAMGALGTRKMKYLQAFAIVALCLLGLLGLLPFFFNTTLDVGWVGWLLWVTVLLLLARRGRVAQSAVIVDESTNPTAVTTGLVCLIIFLLTFVPVPVSI